MNIKSILLSMCILHLAAAHANDQLAGLRLKLALAQSKPAERLHSCDEVNNKIALMLTVTGCAVTGLFAYNALPQSTKEDIKGALKFGTIVTLAACCEGQAKK